MPNKPLKNPNSSYKEWDFNTVGWFIDFRKLSKRAFYLL